MNPCRHSIVSTDNISLKLDDELYEEFRLEEFLLHLKFYHLTRLRYGIYASNQDKFVESVSKFNSMDGGYAEQCYAAFKHLLETR